MCEHTSAQNPGPTFNSQVPRSTERIDHSADVASCITRLYRSELLTDVTFIVQDVPFAAHKVILAVRSEYFRALLYGGLSESSRSVIHLNDISAVAFKHILRYTYTGRLNVRKLRTLLDILGLAHQYGFQNLERALSVHLTYSLHSANVWPIYNLAVLYNLEDLINACLKFLDAIAPAPIRSPQFLELSETAVQRLLSRDSFCASEIEIFRSICAWFRAREDAESNRVSDQSHEVSLDLQCPEQALRDEGTSDVPNTLVSVNACTHPNNDLDDPIQRDTRPRNTDQCSSQSDWLNASIHSGRYRHMMRACVRFELMSLTELLTEVRSSKLISPDDLLDALSRQAKTPHELPHRGWLLPEINLASLRFGCSLVAGEEGSYPYFFVDDNWDAEEDGGAGTLLRQISNPPTAHTGPIQLPTSGDVSADDSEEEEASVGTNDHSSSDSQSDLVADRSTSRGRVDPTVTTRVSSEQLADAVQALCVVQDAPATGLPLTNQINPSPSHVPTHPPTFQSDQPIPSSSGTSIQTTVVGTRVPRTHALLSCCHQPTDLSSNPRIPVSSTVASLPALYSQQVSQPRDYLVRLYQPCHLQQRMTPHSPPPHSEHDVVRHSLDDPDAHIVIRLGKPSIVNTIRMHLWDREARCYSYYVEVSLDQATWSRVVDYRNYMCRSWQTLHFPARVIQYVRITGTRNTSTRTFHVITFRCLYTYHVCKQVNGFLAPTYNVASVTHGATVLEGVSRNRNALIDGNARMYDWNSGYTCHQLGNGAIVVQLAQPFLLRSMRFLLWDLDDRFYSYSVHVSTNREEWRLVHDATQDRCQSWQVITFPMQLVTFIRVVGSYNTANEVFHMVHLECPYPPAEATEDRESSIPIRSECVTTLEPASVDPLDEPDQKQSVRDLTASVCDPPTESQPPISNTVNITNTNEVALTGPPTTDDFPRAAASSSARSSLFHLALESNVPPRSVVSDWPSGCVDESRISGGGGGDSMHRYHTLGPAYLMPSPPDPASEQMSSVQPTVAAGPSSVNSSLSDNVFSASRSPSKVPSHPTTCDLKL